MATVNYTVNGMSVVAPRPKPIIMARSRGDQRGIQFHAATEAPRPDIDEKDHQRAESSADGKRAAQSLTPPVALYMTMVAQ